MVVTKKTKKAADSINARLQLVVKSGKIAMGHKQTIKNLRSGKAKLILISSNCPPLRRSEIQYYAMLARCGVHYYFGTNLDLGTACGKHYPCSVLSIIDAGDSDIVKVQQ
uniref:60S ribosomal protein L30-1 n=1 Tax=Stygiella incarcerata TaxID=1712417 RepID=A0A192ZIG3_9EUKA|nr:60S ribosomal protein L30-1 [Stygiella incarcerata]|eukprot:TRINITY_DN49302_c0_g2_i1.p3 TRINITY_DN49302_c0_g2~~TRINITY_DN49302_c0_g2_i1.p3  ORF type:complete len:110 (-),score=24.68 TRINITY_DN49302_c0_g2_i1:103-432(-)